MWRVPDAFRLAKNGYQDGFQLRGGPHSWFIYWALALLLFKNTHFINKIEFFATQGKQNDV
jgi:hypothetical protein